jgi:ABC-2 type transport system ATP-binding protein
VLAGVDLALEPGSVLGLIGRNGAGKSTLIRAMLGLLVPLAGSTFVFGEPALKLSDATKTRIAYVPQQPEALAWLTAQQMLDYVGRFYPRWDAAFVKTTLARWHIPPNKLLAKLSPGERQRVDLIRALASQPELLVLDEPAAALDPVARRELLREVALRAGEAGTTVLFSTHIVSDLERVASDIAFLHQGKLLMLCSVDETKERYARLWLPAKMSIAAPTQSLSRRRHEDGSLSLVVERDANGDWPEAATLTGARIDALGLEDLFVEIAE